ncbi:translocon-associated alpha [Moniliophthora roreri]|nr:translocon-associated alpha [Moniliophthora roreri]
MMHRRLERQVGRCSTLTLYLGFEIESDERTNISESLMYGSITIA